MQITIKYGVQSLTRTFETAPQIGEVLDDVNVKAVLGYGDNIRPLISGVEQPRDLILDQNAVIVVETRTNTKNRND